MAKHKARTRAADAQAAKALELAWEVRRQRGALRRELRDETIDADALLKGNSERWEPTISRMKAFDLLRLVRGIGPQTARGILTALGFEDVDRVTIQGMTFARRAQMAQEVKSALTLDPLTAPPPDLHAEA